MIAYLIRHGIAEEHEIDSVRKLTDEGVKKLRNTASLMKHIEPRLNTILYSPLVRSIQSAAILGDLFLDASLQTNFHITPDSDPKLIVPWILEQTKSFAIVGHEPHLSGLAEQLCGYGVLGEAGSIKKAGVLGLSCARDKALWEPILYLTPKTIKRLTKLFR